MRIFRLLAASLLVALSMGVSSCGDDVTNEIIQQEPDNTLELLLGTWQGTGEAEGETLTFNKDDTYTEISENETLNGTFEYFPNRYMFVTYYTTDWGEENTIYTVVKITLKSATKLFSVLLASKRPLITELADKLRLKYPLLPTISPCPTMRLEAIRSIIPISCRRYPKSV